MTQSTWTIYDHPRDFPHNYVARRFEGDKPTGDVMVGTDLSLMRRALELKGLVPLPRFQEDDAKIVEVWL